MAWERYEKISAVGLWPYWVLGMRAGGEPEFVEPSEKEVSICAEWIALFGEKQKGISTGNSSYGLKHLVEIWTRSRSEAADGYEQVDWRGRSWTGGYHYVSNGAFIKAAVQAGYDVRRASHESPNAFFNMRISKTAPRGKDLK